MKLGTTTISLNHTQWLLIACLAALALLLSGCALGPDYQRPPMESPTTFSEGNPWKQATPQDTIAKGKWWEIYHDTQLNQLEESTTVSNQDLQAAIARVDQARAISRIAGAQFLPTISANPAGSVSRDSANRPLPPPAPKAPFSTSDVQLPLDMTYEADIWGRVRRSYEAAKANYQASIADMETVRLTLHAEVAETYFNLRSTDSEVAILRNTLDLRKQELDLINNRFKAGASSELEVAQADNAQASAEADLAGVQKNRAELEHALAVLIGKNVETFHLAESPLAGVPPSVPLGTPSNLLERRPDVSESERLMAAANANIGVAKAAFFPVLTLTGTAGFESVNLGSVFDWPSRLWAVGPSISLPLFDAGRNSANYSKAEAAYVETVANYRQQVLMALQEVENGLSGTRFLAQQAEAQQREVAAAQHLYQIANDRYVGGLVNYLEVIDAQRTLLENQREAAQNLGQRYVNSVLLVKALGGGWQDSAIPPMTGPTTGTGK
jgi:multidrug efflux system outer membrane protein